MKWEKGGFFSSRMCNRWNFRSYAGFYRLLILQITTLFASDKKQTEEKSNHTIDQSNSYSANKDKATCTTKTKLIQIYIIHSHRYSQNYLEGGCECVRVGERWWKQPHPHHFYLSKFVLFSFSNFEILKISAGCVGGVWLRFMFQ